MNLINIRCLSCPLVQLLKLYEYQPSRQSAYLYQRSTVPLYHTTFTRLIYKNSCLAVFPRCKYTRWARLLYAAHAHDKQARKGREMLQLHSYVSYNSDAFRMARIPAAGATCARRQINSRAPRRVAQRSALFWLEARAIVNYFCATWMYDTCEADLPFCLDQYLAFSRVPVRGRRWV